MSASSSSLSASGMSESLMRSTFVTVTVRVLSSGQPASSSWALQTSGTLKPSGSLLLVALLSASLLRKKNAVSTTTDPMSNRVTIPSIALRNSVDLLKVEGSCVAIVSLPWRLARRA